MGDPAITKAAGVRTPVRAILDGRGVPIYLQPRRELNPRQQAALLGLWTQTEVARTEALNRHPYIVDIVENTITGQTIGSLMSAVDELQHSSRSWTREGEISVVWDADKLIYTFVAGRRSDAYAVVNVRSNPGHLLLEGGGDFHYEVVENRLDPEASSTIQNILNFAQMRVNRPAPL